MPCRDAPARPHDIAPGDSVLVARYLIFRGALQKPYVQRHERMSSIKSGRNGVQHGAGAKRFPMPVVEYNEEDDSTWDSNTCTNLYSFLGHVQSREFEEALTLAGEMLKLEPENKTLQAYLKVLDEHKDLAEEEEDDDDDDDDDEDDEDDDEEEEEEEADYAHNDNLRGGHEKKKTHK